MHSNSRNLLFVLVVSLCYLCEVSCKREPLPPEPPSDPELTVRNELPPFGAGDGSAELRFTTNRNWEIAIEPLKAGSGSAVASPKAGDEDCSDAMSPKSSGGEGAEADRQRSSTNWYEVSPLNGGPNADGEEITVKVTVQPNDEYEPRGFTIVLKTKPGDGDTKPLEKRIEVTQSKKNAIIIGENRVEVSSDEQTIIVKVQSNVKYEVFIKDGSGWITDEGAKVSGKDGAGLSGNTAANVPGKVIDDPIINSSGGTTTKKASEKSGNISDKVGATGIGTGSTGIAVTGIDNNKPSQSRNEAGDLEITTHSFRITSNQQEVSRTGIIIFKDKDSDMFDELTVTQAAKDVIRLKDGTVNVTNDKQTITVETESNVEYDITIDEGGDWISQAPKTKGLTKRNHSFNIAANPMYEPRTGTITFKDRKSALKVDLKIIQAGKESERTILKAIYESTGGSGWTKRDNWCDDGKPLNEWYGVETDAEGHVVGLRLRGNNLQGALFNSLSKLTHIKYVDISWNATHEDMDESDKIIPDMAALEHIDISHNKLFGELPINFCKLTNLMYMNFSSNDINGPIPIQWGKPMFEGRKAVELILNNNYLRGNLSDPLYNHPEYDRLALQMIRQRYGGDGVGGGVRLDQLKKPIHLPDLTFTDLKTGAERSMKEIYQNNTLTMLFHWDPTQEESQKFVDTVLPRFLTLFGGQGFAAIGILPKDDETPGGNKYKDAARQFLASREIKWAAVEDYKDDQGRRIVLPDYQFPSYIMIDQSGKVTLDVFKGKLIPRIYPKLHYDDMLDLLHIDQLNELFYKTFGDSTYESVDYGKDKTYEQLQRATKGDGVNILLMGDAFSDVDISSGYYKRVMEHCMEAFFALEPTKTYREYFNVYIVYAVSKKSYIGTTSQTALRTRMIYTAPGIECSRQTLDEYVFACMGYTYCSPSVILNGFNTGTTFLNVYSTSTHYGFTGWYPGEFQLLRNKFIHESVGHGFGLLGDEYDHDIDFIGGPIPEGMKRILKGEHERGFFRNLSLTDDPKSVFWSHLIGNPKYPYVGVVEGGYMYTKGVWRSEKDCVMNDHRMHPYFSAWCRELIVRRIMHFAGEKFDPQKFYDNDSDAGRPSSGAESESNGKVTEYRHHSPVFFDELK